MRCHLDWGGPYATVACVREWNAKPVTPQGCETETKEQPITKSQLGFKL